MILSIKLASLLLAAAVSAQTSTDCNPTTSTCPNDLVLPAKSSGEFSAGLPDGWRQVPCKGPLSYGPGGVALGYLASADCPTIETTGTALFGLFEVTMKAAPGKGVVSSIVLESDDLDEVDWEFIGGEDYRVQSNYYGKGDHTTYDRMTYVPVANNQNQWHTYGVNWTSATITWLVDGAPVRTLKYADAQGGARFPQSPMRLRIGVWAPTPSQPGSVEWAGGLADPSKGPYTMSAKSFNIVNYSPGKEYRYKDNTGNWDSIEVIGGSAGGIVAPGGATPSASKPVTISTGSTMVPSNIETKTGGSAPSNPAITTVVKPAPTSNATAATTPAVVSKPSNATASTSKPSATPSTSAKPATTNAGSAFGATSAAIAGLSLLFLAFLA